jgi:hypothetical protein
MTLKEWLDWKGLSHAQFGARIKRTAEAVRRYAAGDRIPDRETMPRIVKETEGHVTANSFFDIPEASPPPFRKRTRRTVGRNPAEAHA